MRILFLFLISISSCWAQELDSGYVEKPIPKNEIKAILGYYSQDGNHSAVTGGEGTEELVVKSSRITFIRKTDSNNRWVVKTGLDQITSASTDEINYVEAGNNYGWPAITYGINYSGAFVSPFKEAPGMDQPLKYWTPSIAPSGFAIYQGDAFPAWQGDFFVGALVNKEVRRLEMVNGKIVSEEALFSDSP